MGEAKYYINIRRLLSFKLIFFKIVKLSTTDHIKIKMSQFQL
jgi:hypothetical protein